jgi:hypothetical protein
MKKITKTYILTKNYLSYFPYMEVISKMKVIQINKIWKNKINYLKNYSNNNKRSYL